MAVLGLFVKSIFLVALMIAIFIIGVIIYLYLRVKRVARTFAAGAGQRSAGTSQRTAGTGQRNAESSQSSRHTSSQQQAADYANTDFGDEELYDQRSPREINRKIFRKDEGEYVEFEEES